MWIAPLKTKKNEGKKTPYRPEVVTGRDRLAVVREVAAVDVGLVRLNMPRESSPSQKCEPGMLSDCKRQSASDEDMGTAQREHTARVGWY